jgi:hypothetical protein
MRPFVFLLITVFMLGACSQVVFTNSKSIRGVALSSFPGQMHGVYTDSVIRLDIYDDGFTFGAKHYRLTKKTPVKDQVQVKYSNDFYFAILPYEQYFQVFMVKYSSEQIAVYMLNADKYSLNILQRFTALENVTADSTLYVIDPSRSEFIELVNNEVFDVVGVYKRQ